MQANNQFSWDLEYRDKWGRPIGMDECELLLRNREYCVIQHDLIGDYFISTVWLGIPTERGDDYFETGVFRASKEKPRTYCYHKDLEKVYHKDLKDAELGHLEMIKKWLKKQGLQEATE